MIIEKLATNKGNYKYKEYFYNSARNGIHDLTEYLFKKGCIDKVLLPGYIGWSPKEGSGIFDSLSSIHNCKLEYYQMTSDLNIVTEDIKSKISDKCLFFIINYFGFRDFNFTNVLTFVKEQGGLILEDNAHGFFTYHTSCMTNSDFVVFSLHKVFPFSYGGSILIQNRNFNNLQLKGSSNIPSDINPYAYDFSSIANRRRQNYKKLSILLESLEKRGLIKSLRKLDDLSYNVPQTYPIKILIGNRDEIYNIMNQKGFGVVSLYHTLINDLHTTEYREALSLSKQILNLPVHQDVDEQMYLQLVDLLEQSCLLTNAS